MYSVDFRRSVVNQYANEGEGLRETARRTGVAVNTLQGWREQKYRTGDVLPKPHGGGPKRLLDWTDDWAIKAWIRRKPDISNAEIIARLAKRGKIVSEPCVSRSVKRQNITRKKRPNAPPRGTLPAS